MGTRAVTVGAAAGAAGMSSEAGLVGMSGVPRLLEDLARLSEDKDSADIVFLLGRDETPIYAHRLILQARSVLTFLFMKMFIPPSEKDLIFSGERAISNG